MNQYNGADYQDHAIHYYDDLIVEKLRRWIPEAATLRVLHPDETKKLFELHAEDSGDKEITLPLIALSRKDEVELLSTSKNVKSYDGLTLIPDGTTLDFSRLKGEEYTKAREAIPSKIYKWNVLPIRPEYQLDIYAKTALEAEEYLRSFLFKIIKIKTIKLT